MKKIKILAEHISEELEDAEKYAKCALKMKDDDVRLADLFFNLSKQELEHSNLLHTQVERLIKEYDGEVPEAMRIVYDWEHERHIEKYEAIGVLHSMYK